MNPTESRTSNLESQRKSSGKSWLLIIAGVLLLSVAIVAGTYYYMVWEMTGGPRTIKPAKFAPQPTDSNKEAVLFPDPLHEGQGPNEPAAEPRPNEKTAGKSGDSK